METYDVELSITYLVCTTVTVEAPSEREAKTAAIDYACNLQLGEACELGNTSMYPYSVQITPEEP